MDNYTLTAIEDLNLAFMTRNHHVAVSAHGTGLAAFRHLLEHNAAKAGNQVVAVNPAYTSQRCYWCGETAKNTLSICVHECPHCDLKLDRNTNAAVNLLQSARPERSGANVDGCVMRSPRLCPLKKGESSRSYPCSIALLTKHSLHRTAARLMCVRSKIRMQCGQRSKNVGMVT